MRTTIRLPDDLFAKFKQLSTESHRTLTAVIEEALRESLARRAGAGRSGSAKLPAFGVGGVREGVDLDDTAALLDRMEERDDPR
jgi:hypothetical protein